ncbi:MAG: hypothetical protein CNC06_00975 [Pelagibacterales bacterium MED-G40]|nr:MAG: hypothetical protein CNC06_00975 [Pelagibacterales bacterium MED-G40]|tara:strand:- start:240 stop:506 length:267 start_codon:yes stop_codon:yes gene_type:complete
MKLFVYKTLFIFGCIFILFQLTFGVKIKEFKYELNEIKSRENIIYFKDKLRKELKNAVEKENYLNPEDAKLINDFINKIKLELSRNNQ